MPQTQTISPETIRKTRQFCRLTQEQAGGLIFQSAEAWASWEKGTVPMPQSLWEFFRLKIMDPESFLH